mgnify:FL=1
MVNSKKIVSSLVLGSVIGLGIYGIVRTKKKYEFISNMNNIVDSYNMHHNNSNIELSSTQSINPSERNYHVLYKQPLKIAK